MSKPGSLGIDGPIVEDAGESVFLAKAVLFWSIRVGICSGRENTASKELLKKALNKTSKLSGAGRTRATTDAQCQKAGNCSSRRFLRRGG
jgi:hypothetical protein